MTKRLVCGLLLLALSACEPVDLTRKNFRTCANPSAEIGVTIDRLDVTLFLINPQGDLDVVGWDPGDGKGRSRLGTRVTYNYERPGTYTVTLNVANGCDQTYTTTRTITVRN